jgi:hypothetical protein
MIDVDLYGRLLFAHQNNPSTGKCGICDETNCYFHSVAAATMRAEAGLPSRHEVAGQIQAASLRETAAPGGPGRFMVHGEPTREQSDHVLRMYEDRLSQRRSGLG